MIMEVLRTVTADEQRLFTLQNLNGDTVDCQHIFTLHPNQIGAVFGRMLRKYVASPECYALALALHCKPLEEIQLGDVEDYEDMLTSDDLEDLLMSNAPKILYGRTIAREFYENGQVKQEAAEEYGLVYVPAAVDTDSWPFPSNGLISLKSLNSYMNEQLRAAPSLISGTVEKTVRGYYKNGRFCELDRMPSRQAQLANYTAANNGEFCFCQMCRKPKKKAFIEVASILQEPSRFLPQLYLALCLECSKRFQGLREAKKSDFSRELYDKIMAAPVHALGNVTIDMQDSFGLSLTFTETHLAEIQAVLPKLAGAVDNAISETGSTTDIPSSSAPAAASVSSALDPACDSAELAQLRGNAFAVHVTGDEAGDYKLVVYSNKLKNHTDATPEQRFLPIEHQGRSKLIPVSFVARERTIYIAKNIYYTYSEVIQQMPALEMIQRPV